MSTDRVKREARYRRDETRITAKFKRLARKIAYRGDLACGELMDKFGISRAPGNYLAIIKILSTYRRTVLRIHRSR